VTKAPEKNAAAVALGKLRVKSMTAEEHKAMAQKGGIKGGRVRAQKLTPAQRKKIAAKAAAARWAKKKPTGSGA